MVQCPQSHDDIRTNRRRHRNIKNTLFSSGSATACMSTLEARPKLWISNPLACCPFWGTDRLLTRPKGAHTRPLTSHRLDPVGRHRDNPANGTKTQSHSTVGRPRRRERQGGRVGGVGLEGEDVVDKVLLIMLGSSPPRRSIRAGEGGGLGQRQGGGVPRHSSCCRWLPLRGAISVVLCGS